MRHDLGEHVQFANSAGDELRVLGAEVDNEHRRVCGSVGGGVGGCLRLTQGVNRTAAQAVARTLVLSLIMLAAGATAVVGSAIVSDAPLVVASVPVDEPITTDVPLRPPITANDFLPADRDVTDCIGVLERPGCGSESRGGWRQTAVLGAIFVGLAIVFGNVIRGVRKNRQ